MSGVGAGTAAAIGAGVGAVGSIASSSLAGDAQSDAAASANATQWAMFNKTQENLKPYMSTGESANTALAKLLGLNEGGDTSTSALLNGVTLDQATLEKTPGYQWNLAQGLKAAQNSATSRGLGISGAAQKVATTYATGLADSTYQNQFNNAVTNQTNTYNRLLSLMNLGENAAAGVGNAATTTGQGIAQTTASLGNAQAANYLSAGNSISNLGNNVLSYQMLKGLYGDSGSGVSGGNNITGND